MAKSFVAHIRTFSSRSCWWLSRFTGPNPPAMPMNQSASTRYKGSHDRIQVPPVFVQARRSVPWWTYSHWNAGRRRRRWWWVLWGGWWWCCCRGLKYCILSSSIIQAGHEKKKRISFFLRKKKLKQLVVYTGGQPTCREDMMKVPREGKGEKDARNSYTQTSRPWDAVASTFQSSR